MAQGSRASVYSENPVVTPQRVLVPFALNPTAGLLATPQLSVVACVERGDRVSIAEFAESLPRCTFEVTAHADDAAHYVFSDGVPRAASTALDPYAEVSAFFHATKAIAYFLDLLGSADERVVVERLRIVVGGRVAAKLLGLGGAGLAPNTATFYLRADDPGELFRRYSGLTGNVIWLGESETRSSAYDGDVVAHEVSHAVLDRLGLQPSWFYDEVGSNNDARALHEALADYFAGAIHNNPAIGEHASPGRTLRKTARRLAPTGEPHLDGEPLAAALWAARSATEPTRRSELDRAVLAVAAQDHATTLDGFSRLLLIHLERALPSAFGAFTAECDTRGLLRADSAFIPLPFDEDGVAVDIEPRFSPGELRVGPALVQYRVSAEGARQIKIETHSEVGPRTVWSLPASSDAEAAEGIAFSWDRPLRWKVDDARNGQVPSVDGTAQLLESGRIVEAPVVLVDVPPGATSLFVQLVNLHGQQLTTRLVRVERFPLRGQHGTGPPVADSSVGPAAGGCSLAASAPAPAVPDSLIELVGMLLLLRRAGGWTAYYKARLSRLR